MTERELRPPRLFQRLQTFAKRELPLALAMGLIGIVLGGLLFGYEPSGGDPERLYRPLKSELARSLALGKLPFWSDRFGLGVPLVAESHVAAFYPPNLLFYRVFHLRAAYRLSMWLHYVALVASTYAYARCLKISPWGSALAGVAISLCGFQAIHSSHEPFYCVMPYLPAALALAEIYLASGRALWLALLALALGIGWTLGHFQIQAWTLALVILTALWRSVVDHRSWKRAAALIATTLWGSAIAAVQLGPSWQFADLVGHTHRSSSELLYYSFPPVNWFDLVLPQLIRELQNGPVDPYWPGLQTEGYEVAFYVGTIPLVLAFVALFAQPRSPLDVAVETAYPDLFRRGHFAPVVACWLLAADRSTRGGLFSRACPVHVVLQPGFGDSGRGRSRSHDFEGAVSSRTRVCARLCDARRRCGGALDIEIRRASCALGSSVRPMASSGLPSRGCAPL